MPGRLLRTTAVALLFAAALAAPVHGRDPDAGRRRSLARLAEQGGADVRLRFDPASGLARSVAAAPGKRIGLARRGARASGVPANRAAAAAFLREYGALFGVANAPAELEEIRVARDPDGGTHLVYRQRHRGLPVFAGELLVHFDAADRLTGVNGRFVPVDLVDGVPTRSAEEAGRSALAIVAAEPGGAGALRVERAGALGVGRASLLVFREGPLRGMPGATHLAWELEVGDGGSTRELVFVDAHTGKLVDRISRTPDALFRRAYNARREAAPGPDYPDAPVWVEGDPLPTPNGGANEMLEATRETWELYARAFGRDSFDGAGAVLDGIFNRGDDCPNASWNGLFASFCRGMTGDDIVAHEWSHAYTEHTHGLIYQWQPGALNESYSDIFGEVVDRLNGRGSDAPDTRRGDGECAESTASSPGMALHAPQALVGAYPC